jgi:glycosyltransferase involved in cell wall biosynthesis
MVDLAAIDAAIATPQTSVPAGTPYLMFVGKLERNKGAHLLAEIFREFVGLTSRIEDRRSKMADRSSIFDPLLSLPTLVIAGDGPLRGEIERELSALGVRTRWLDWIDHDEALRLMAGCELLLFPSAWGEPLSRVPIEAGACGAAVLAMPTGGTTSIVVDGVSGALEPTTSSFARRLAVLLADPAERRRLGAGARRQIERHFAKDVVVARVEQLYWEVMLPGG